MPLFHHTKIQKTLKSTYGTTLIETMIAIVILSLALLALSGMQVSAFYISNDSGKLTQAMVAAQDTVELLMNLSYGDANIADTTPVNTYTTYSMSNSNLNISPPVGIDITWEVDDLGDNTKLINIRTTWNNRKRQKSLVLPLRVYQKEGA